MAALPAGVQYGLSSEPSYKENKELVFVKLTDSALKAIEDFLRNNKDKLAKPKIQFLPGNEGKISIPACNSGQIGEATFRFSLNSNAEMEGPQGSFECVRSNAPRRLESCGALPRRMRVHANDDSYEATKDRMAKTVAAEQSKCTRVIKPNQNDIGRRVKVRSSHPNPHPLPYSNHSSPHPVVPPPARAPAQPPPVQHVQHATPHVTQPPQPLRTPGNPEIARRSIKERLIQLLALKPFKKPELYLRLNTEGLKEKERVAMNKILPQIGTLKDNCYHLRRHIWNDVNEDWPYYTEDEKRMLKRRKPQNLTPPVSSDSCTSLSPRSPGGKRSGNGSEADLPSKKQRISHYRRPDAPSTVAASPSSGYATAGSGASSGERHASDNEDERTGELLHIPYRLVLYPSTVPASPSSGYATVGSGSSSGEQHASDNEDERTVKKDNGYTLSYNTVKDLCPSPVKSNGFANSPPVEQNRNTEKDITSSEPLENNELPSAPDENQTELEEIVRQYPPITCSQSRRAYKDEFAMLYLEYRSLYDRLADVAAYFSRLEQKLQRAQPRSSLHQSIQQRIVEEYRKLRNDHKYQEEKRRVDYLHRKLQHIKLMVHRYDSLRNMKTERLSSASTTQAY